jgi:hypothetical protein
MTSKVYKSAQGKMVDLGTIMLQNEHVRAVGNMKVNARGDKLDSNNQVIDTKPKQIQRQNNQTSTNVTSAPVHTSSRKNREAKKPADPETIVPKEQPVEQPSSVQETVPVQTPTPPAQHIAPVQRIIPPAPVQETAPPVVPIAPQSVPAVDLKNPSDPAKSPAADSRQPAKGGLAGAISRTREIKQELDRTRRQQAQDGGVKKI